MEGVEGKVVAITGASSGIGEATAILLASQGAKIVLAARNSEKLKALAAKIITSGGEAVYAETDVTRRQDLEVLVTRACEQYGKIDVLVNNAGVGPISLMDELRVEDWDEMIDVNLRGVLHGIAAALPVFRKQGYGHFINIISTAGIKILPTMAVYAGTKNAVRTITEALRQEAGAHLRVTGISPGMVRTEFSSSITSPEIKKQILERALTAALPPEAIARSVSFVISQPSDVEIGDLVIRPTAQG